MRIALHIFILPLEIQGCFAPAALKGCLPFFLSLMKPELYLRAVNKFAHFFIHMACSPFHCT